MRPTASTTRRTDAPRWMLKNLLLSESSLRKRSQDEESPYLLRTCRTFAEAIQRTPLLDMNAFVLNLQINRSDASIWFLDYVITPSVKVHPQKLSHIPSTLFQKVQNVIVKINIDYGSKAKLHTEAESIDDRIYVANLVLPLKEFVALQNLEIHVQNAQGLAKDNPLGNDILYSLQELRRLKSVTILGTSPTHALEMKAIMESSEASVNLQDMGNALRKYMEPGFCTGEDWNEAEDALSSYDVEGFRKASQRILAQDEAEIAVLRVQLCLHDKN